MGANAGGRGERVVVFFYFKNKFIRISSLLEGISRKKLSQNSCSGFAFTSKRKDS
jgi:hypothetical protein